LIIGPAETREGVQGQRKLLTILKKKGKGGTTEGMLAPMPKRNQKKKEKSRGSRAKISSDSPHNGGGIWKAFEECPLSNAIKIEGRFSRSDCRRGKIERRSNNCSLSKRAGKRGRDVNEKAGSHGR